MGKVGVSARTGGFPRGNGRGKEREGGLKN